MTRIACPAQTLDYHFEVLDPQAACKIRTSFSGARVHRINCRVTPGMKMTQNVMRREGDGKVEGRGEEGEWEGGREKEQGGIQWID